MRSWQPFSARVGRGPWRGCRHVGPFLLSCLLGTGLIIGFLLQRLERRPAFRLRRGRRKAS